MKLRFFIRLAGAWGLAAITLAGAVGQPRPVPLRFPDSVLQQPTQHRPWWDQALPRLDTAHYQPPTGSPYARFGYEGHTVDWRTLQMPAQPHRVVGVDLVFTLYPARLTDWGIDYHQLLAQRVVAVLAKFPHLNHPRARWRVVRQVGATSLAQAKQLFHGVVLHVQPAPAKPNQLPPPNHQAVVAKYRPALDTFTTRPEYHEPLVSRYFTEDTTRLPGSAIVMDWTASMYAYGCDAILASLLRQPGQQARWLAFFNDGDGKRNAEKVVGQTGGIYQAAAANPEQVLAAMRLARKKGGGGDNPENDLEAVLAVANQHPEVRSIHLVADNRSAMRDSSLLPRLPRPVNVILCNTRFQLFGRWFRLLNAQYWQVARQTGGQLYFDGLDSAFTLTKTDWPTLRVDDQLFYVLDPTFRFTLPPEAKLIFYANGIDLAPDMVPKQPAAVQKTMEMNEANFPAIIKLNEALHRGGPKMKPKKREKIARKLAPVDQ
ncbi:MAG: hypothetical protein MUC97_02745 [Bernardetiaceae bacterium]|nr:hypothetical protein [Bernardetiaceae bacterium]